jgi:hypothetical protein
MLCKALPINKDTWPPSPAQVPFVVIVGVYFCALVVANLSVDETATSQGYYGFLSATRDAANATIEAILPRLIANESITNESAEEGRNKLTEAKALADACNDPVTLGMVMWSLRLHWMYLHTTLVASSSALLQTFLYLYEKWRLDALKPKSCGGDNDHDDDGYDHERLLGALMDDPRVAPLLLLNGRPTTAQQCIQGISRWIFTLGEVGSRMSKIVEGRFSKQVATILSAQIVKEEYAITKTMQDRLLARKGNGKDDDLKNYLIWGANTPNCLKLEAALINAFRKQPQWQEMCLSVLKRTLAAKEGWQNAVQDVIIAGFDVLMEKSETTLAYLHCDIRPSLEDAILKCALQLPGHEESLKAALAETFASNTDQVLKATMSLLQAKFKEFDISFLSKSFVVETSACILWMLPNLEIIENKQKRRIKKPSPQNPEEDELPSEVVGRILPDIMEEAGPILRETYGWSESPSTSTSNIEGMIGRMTV